MKDSEVVAAARELISDEKNWVKGTWCEGTRTTVKLCAEGAVRYALGLYEYRPEIREGYWEPAEATPKEWGRAARIEDALAETAKELLPELADEAWAELHEFNDNLITEHADVLAIFDKTYNKLVEEGK